MRYYDETAEVYDFQYRKEQTEKYREALKAVSILRIGYILDLGCGSGLFIKEAADLGGRIVCVDFSKNMIRKAKAKIDCAGQSAFVCADADHLPFKEKAFDHIFSFTLLQNMPAPEKTVAEICRVAKVGSEMTLSVTKKAFTNSSFLRLLNEGGLAIVKFVDKEELKDYIAVCKKV